MAKLSIDLHPIYNQSEAIEELLHETINKASEKRVKEVEIVCGKGRGQLKKRVLKFLDQKDIRDKYHRIKKDPDNFGRIFVYFK